MAHCGNSENGLGTRWTQPKLSRILANRADALLREGLNLLRLRADLVQEAAVRVLDRRERLHKLVARGRLALHVRHDRCAALLRLMQTPPQRVGRLGGTSRRRGSQCL